MSGYEEFVGEYVLITDTHRGVYAGQLLEVFNEGKSVRVDRARHCFYYIGPEGHEGTYGLASYGPGDESKIGPRWYGIINDVAKIVRIEPEAKERWETAKWSQ